MHNTEELTSSHAIVKNSDEYEENIKTGEDNEEKVEGVPHLLGGEHDDDEDVAENTNTAHTCLEEILSRLDWQNEMKEINQR